MKYLAILLITTQVSAFEICDQMISQLTDTGYLVCGQGDQRSRYGALRWAKDTAFDEFKELCDMNERCKGKSIKVEPLKTECKEDLEGIFGSWKCQRLFNFIIED